MVNGASLQTLCAWPTNLPHWIYLECITIYHQDRASIHVEYASIPFRFAAHDHRSAVVRFAGSCLRARSASCTSALCCSPLSALKFKKRGYEFFYPVILYALVSAQLVRCGRCTQLRRLRLRMNNWLWTTNEDHPESCEETRDCSG
jgi:hypothetical protein